MAPPGFCKRGEVRYGSIGGLEYEVPQSRLYCLCINVALCSTALKCICCVIRRSSMTMKAHTYYIIFGRPPIAGEASPLPPWRRHWGEPYRHFSPPLPALRHSVVRARVVGGGDSLRRLRSLNAISLYTMYTRLTCNGGTRHLPPPRRRTRQLLSGRGGCARGQTSCGLDAKRQTAVSRASEPAVSR